MMRHPGRVAVALALVAIPSLRANAQERDPLARLEPRVRYAVDLLLDSARLAGLPVAPLESKALQGIAKKADDRRILFQVRNVFRQLKEASGALGPRATQDELTAAAGALSAGITTAELAQLARARHEKQLTVPLVVLADLITRGVPRDTASFTISQLWQRGAADEDFLGLWRGVERDIVSGTDPGVALLNRAREIPSRGTPSMSPPSGRPE
jgi:hypothetical protein